MKPLLAVLFLASCAPIGVPANDLEARSKREKAYRCGVLVGARWIDYKPWDEECEKIRKEFEQEGKMQGRFDYVGYDNIASTKQAYFKMEISRLETAIEEHKPGRAKSLALTALEECFMWIGKMIRDEQIERTMNTPLGEREL